MDVCILCKSSRKDDIQYGNFLQNNRFGVHTFCLYLSSNLSQNGADDEGFLGFLEDDIKKEVRRVYHLKCSYCHKRHANIGCCEKKCRSTFHLICGLENNAQNRFCHDFRSYCHKHARKVRERPSSDATCLICYESLFAARKIFNHVNMILTPCCRNGWFHKLCLQKFAKTSGYFFKCPLCNDVNTFREKLPARGIFIPNQDAEWELEPNAFAELLERPDQCAAKHCKNKSGRKDSLKNNPFVMCITCGSTAIHKQCLNNGDKQYHCADCTVVLREVDSGSESLNSQNNEDEYIDVCHVSDNEDIEIFTNLIDINRKLENKRDSGMHTGDSDDEVPHTARCCNKIRRIGDSIEENLLKYDSECDDIIKPSAVNQKRRISSDPEDSILKQVSDSKLRSEAESNESILDDEIIKPKATQRRIFSTDSENSVNTEYTEFKHGKRKYPNLYNDFNSEHQHKNDSIKTTQLDLESHNHITAISQCNNELIKSSTSSICSRKKSFGVISDSEDELTQVKLNVLKCENYNNGKNINKGFQNMPIERVESDEDDDSLGKGKDISCIALRTRRSTHLIKGHNFTAKENSCKKEINQMKNVLSEENTKRSKLVKLVSPENFPKQENSLDISCIAKRTRRKALSSASNNGENDRQKKFNPISTRRKTICAQPHYSKEIICEMSQVFEKTYTSDENLQISKCDYDIVVDDGYEKDIKFEISCVANRTRKRKSLRSENYSISPNSSNRLSERISSYTRNLT